MTGRRLYDALTDAWAEKQTSWGVNNAMVLKQTPPAWAFLQGTERAAFNAAARALTPTPRVKR